MSANIVALVTELSSSQVLAITFFKSHVKKTGFERDLSQQQSTKPNVKRKVEKVVCLGLCAGGKAANDKEKS